MGHVKPGQVWPTGCSLPILVPAGREPNGREPPGHKEGCGFHERGTNEYPEWAEGAVIYPEEAWGRLKQKGAGEDFTTAYSFQSE